MADIGDQRLLTGYTIPCLGLGTLLANAGQVGNAVKSAIDLGYRHIDCALDYGNEKEIGAAIREKIDDGTVKREEMFITTKLWSTQHSTAGVREGFGQSLADLCLDYIDLYLIHWPIALREGGDKVPIRPDGKVDAVDIDYTETWTAMQELVDQGLCRSLGVSNFNSKQIQRILDLGLKHPLACNQIEISPYLANEKLLQFCKSKDIVVVAYAPLGAAERPWSKPEDPVLLKEPEIGQIALQHNKSPAQVLLRWGIQRGYVVIPKSVSPERQKENINVFDFELSDNDMKVISGIKCYFRSLSFEIAGAKESPFYPFNEEF